MYDKSLPKSCRLLKKRDFDNLKNDSSFIKNSDFKMVVKRNNFDHARLGMAIGRKFGPAVVRNAFKRYSRELFRNSKLKSHYSYDFLVIAVGKYHESDSRKLLNNIFLSLENRITKNVF